VHAGVRGSNGAHGGVLDQFIESETKLDNNLLCK
jgi:hypothetical protein